MTDLRTDGSPFQASLVAEAHEAGSDGGPAAVEELTELARTMESMEPLEGLRAFREAVVRAVPHLKNPDSAASGELKSFYRLAIDLWNDPGVVELIVDRSSPKVLSTMEKEHPELHSLVARHIDDFAWVRASHFTIEPTTPRDLIQRLQKVFLRWSPEKIAPLAAKEGPAVGSLLQAQYLARPAFQKMAEQLGCTLNELMLFSAAEIEEALSGAGLPAGAIEAKTVRLDLLTGQSVALGRAAGRVRIIQQGAGGGRLQLGDVLVTGLSSPDHAGAASVFPTRTDASVPVEGAAAILIDDGGLLSHAAMISRELGIPCVVGTERATSTLEEGQVVEVDATRSEGVVVPYV